MSEVPLYVGVMLLNLIPETLHQKRLADAKGSNKKKKQDKRLGVNPDPKR